MSIMHPSKKTLLTALASLLVLTALAGGPVRRNTVFQQYIDQYKGVAIEEMQKYGIPASITLAQGLLESGAGRSELSVKGNNHFGIKCHGWTGRKTYHDDDEQGECFRAYNTVYESYEDHSFLLKNSPRYSSLFSLSMSDYRGWAHGLKRCGYATSPTYAQQLIGIIELYKLQQYDKSTKYDHFMAIRSQKDASEAQGGLLHPIHIYNKNYYVKVRRGDTFRSLGRELGLSYRKLARYNERGKDDKLQEGETIYLKKKQTRAVKAYKNRPHTVKAGESMYSIAQYYGIRLKSLYKKNGLSPDYTIRVGDRLRVR